jgi:hypothetical protein
MSTKRNAATAAAKRSDLKAAARSEPPITKASLSRREWRLRAIEHGAFADALDWLVLRSYQSLRDGSDSDHRGIPWPNDPLETGLASFSRNVVNIRRAVEKRSGQLREKKYAAAKFELCVLLETLCSLAEAHKLRAAAYQKSAQKFGRPLSENAQLREIKKELGLEVTSPPRKSSGRKRSIDITNEQLDCLVREMQHRHGVSSVREACRRIATNRLEAAGKLPAAEWRRRELVGLESKRLASRHSRFRRARSEHPQGVDK